MNEEPFPVSSMPARPEAEKKRITLQEIICYCAYDTDNWIQYVFHPAV